MPQGLPADITYLKSTKPKGDSAVLFTSVPCEILQSSHGEIQLKILMLSQSDYAATLQEMIYAIDGVSRVKVRPAMPAVVVYFKQGVLSESDFKEVLLSLVQQAANLRWARAMTAILLPGYRAITLSPYEFTKILQISQWMQRPAAAVTQLLEEVENPLRQLVNQVVSDAVVDDLYRAYDRVTLLWPQLSQADPAPPYSKTGLKAGSETLQEGDRKTTALRHPLLATTGFEGGIAGLLDVVGEVTNSALLVLLALTTIHQVGECYGYCPSSDLEQQFAWSILKVAVAGDAGDRQGAIADLHQLQRFLYRQTLDDRVDDTLTEGVEKKLVEVVLERAVRRMAATAAEDWIPVVGTVINIRLNLHFLSTVLIAAYREFQLRWLLDHQRLTV